MFGFKNLKNSIKVILKYYIMKKKINSQLFKIKNQISQ